MTSVSVQERVYHDLPPRRSSCDGAGSDIRCGSNVGPSQTVLDGRSLDSRTVAAVARKVSLQIRLSEQCRAIVRSGRDRLDDRVRDGDAIYGATTGVGGFAGWLLSPDQAARLQQNLIAAVASNMGPYLPDDAVRAAMLARINVLARGHSAIRLEVVDQLVEMFNRGVIPRIPSLGSLGASGDLGPLACIALVATGSWQAVVEGQATSGGEALARVNLKPLKLSYKEGLSLINGTSAMTGLGALNIADAQQLLASYHRISTLTLEALRAKIKPFTPSLHELKNHPGQIRSATRIFEHLSGSRLAVVDDVLSERLKGERSSEASQGSDPIEDSYVLRCTPQILGPVIDTLDFVTSIIDRELNATSDNPVILPSTGEIFHNGHFHGQYVSAAMDYLSIALTTLSNLADRRVDRLLSPHYNNGLPAFLCEANQGTRLGLMGVQFMATSATAENRSLCHPVSVQTLPSTGGFQDHVSMGLVAARRCRQILDNAARIVACELLCACQAADIRGSDLLSPSSKASLACVREIVPYFEDDVIVTPFLERLWSFLTDPASPLAREDPV